MNISDFFKIFTPGQVWKVDWTLSGSRSLQHYFQDEKQSRTLHFICPISWYWYLVSTFKGNDNELWQFLPNAQVESWVMNLKLWLLDLLFNPNQGYLINFKWPLYHMYWLYDFLGAVIWTFWKSYKLA